MSGPRGPRTLIVAPGNAFADTAARWIAERIRHAVRRRGAASVALAGGDTPAEVYRRLAGLEVPWARVHLFFGDERRVPPDHPDSNYRMAREALLAALPAEPAGVHRMRGEDPDGAAAAAAYEALLPDALDVILLGMGDDAHTASLFPGSDALLERTRRVLAVDGPPGGAARLTLTPPALAAARDRVVMVAGEAKAGVVVAVLGDDYDPVARPIQLALHGTWILDDAAAGRLARRA